jgi:hypothetical protein
MISLHCNPFGRNHHGKLLNPQPPKSFPIAKHHANLAEPERTRKNDPRVSQLEPIRVDYYVATPAEFNNQLLFIGNRSWGFPISNILLDKMTVNCCVLQGLLCGRSAGIDDVTFAVVMAPSLTNPSNQLVLLPTTPINNQLFLIQTLRIQPSSSYRTNKRLIVV